MPNEGLSGARRLEAIDARLPALFEALDVREVFTRVSEIAKDVLPHDAVGLPLLTDDREHVVPYATLGLGNRAQPDLQPIPESMRYLLTEPWELDIFQDTETVRDGRAGPYFEWGFRSAIRVPIRLDGQISGMLTFFARQANVYSDEYVPLVRRIATYVALTLSHQRLAERAR